MDLKKLKVALVHEYFQKKGGAENVLKVLSDIFPEAPIYTLIYDEENVKAYGLDIERFRDSRLQSLPNFIKNKRFLLTNKFAKEVESFDLSEYDLVISSSNSFAKGIITSSHTLHISYCHSPTRYLWDWTHEYFEENKFGPIRKALAIRILNKLRMWDKLAADRPDIFIANSITVQGRISKYYQRDSVVIYPPVETDRFKLSNKIEDFFLIVSTLSPYKKIDLAIRFFNKTGKKLVIVGEGKQRAELMSLAGPSIEFLGNLNNDEVANLMSRCRGLIFPGEDDFGIVAVEAMAAGRPVFAYKKGGASETIIDKETGILFEEQNLESFEKGFAKFLSFEKKYFDPKKAKKISEKYSKEQFKKSIKGLIESSIEK